MSARSEVIAPSPSEERGKVALSTIERSRQRRQTLRVRKQRSDYVNGSIIGHSGTGIRVVRQVKTESHETSVIRRMSFLVNNLGLQSLLDLLKKGLARIQYP